MLLLSADSSANVLFLAVDAGRARAKSMPRSFGKRTRPVVEGVPRSSLYSRDDSSAEFSRIFAARADGMAGDDSSDDEAPTFSAWDAGRRRRQARVSQVVGKREDECGFCGEGDGDDMVPQPPTLHGKQRTLETSRKEGKQYGSACSY